MTLNQFLDSLSYHEQRDNETYIILYEGAICAMSMQDDFGHEFFMKIIPFDDSNIGVGAGLPCFMKFEPETIDHPLHTDEVK